MVYIQNMSNIKMAKNKKEIKIFLDIDGVCVDWLDSASKLIDIDLRDKEVREKAKSGKNIFNVSPFSIEECWEKLSEEGNDFWENLEPFPWMQRLFDELNKRTDNFCFLTSPSRDPYCASGKIKWMQKYFGEEFQDYLIGKHKQMCATPNSILIDDSEDKIKNFEEAGGHGFLWPHALRIEDGEIDIEDVFKDLFEAIDKI